MGKKDNLENWKKNAINELKNINVDDISINTPEGINIKPLYTSADNENISHLDTYPGEPVSYTHLTLPTKRIV